MNTPIPALQQVAQLKCEHCQGCSGWKRSGHSFCARCYRVLTPEMQKRLYYRIGDGYEEAYEAALMFIFFERGKQVERKTHRRP